MTRAALFLMVLLYGAPLPAAPPVECSRVDLPETRPRPVDLNLLITTIGQLETTDGRLEGIPLTKSLQKELAGIFRQEQPRTKLDQFYRMLHVVAMAYPRGDRREVFLSGPSVARVLKAAAVIDHPDFLSRLQSFHLVYVEGKDPFYEVEYAGDETRFPLNQGRGFTIWRNGMCQMTESLLFKKNFSFRLQLRPRSRNLLVYDYNGVDLYGTFGTRLPLIKIDLNYVTVESVEFIEGTNLGIVKARVSREEFVHNEHTWILKTLTRLVGDTSTQPIDW